MKRYKKSIILSFIFVLVIVVICIGSSYSLFKIDKKGEIHNKVITGTTEEVCEYENGYVWNFDYTGGEQEFTVPCDGYYKLETWGAQGGNVNTIYIGGYGGYARGSAYLIGNEKIYINIGGTGTIYDNYILNKKNVSAPGYNGGGAGGMGSTHSTWKFRYFASGGGATHMAFQSGQLENLESLKGTLASNHDYYISNEIILVSGGGGGAVYQYSNDKSYEKRSNGGSGGGLHGVDEVVEYLKWSNDNFGYGGTQISAGRHADSTLHQSAAFGKGLLQESQIDNNAANGGGGGFFGGGIGSGGSGYIGNPLLSNKSMYCYNCQESNEINTKTISTTCHSTTPTENCAKEGNGYARITLVQSNNNVLPPVLSSDGTFQSKATVRVETSGEAKSGVKYYEYYVTQENIPPTKETIPSGTTNNEIEINTAGVNYVFYRTVSNAGTKSNWSNKTTITINLCEYNLGQVWNFDYTGNEQSFIIPCDGTYKLETWGAQGGTYNTTAFGGYGGYSNGSINLDIDQVLYINVGGAGNGNGTHSYQVGGYNGGGNASPDSDGNTRQSSGGGATHIATISGLLENLSNNIDDILIVSGAGGGAIANAATAQVIGGHAGGYIGYSLDPSNTTGGSQISSGIAYHVCNSVYDQDGSFGKGGSGVYSGAGGGFYGGAVSCGYATTGGSGYIGNLLLTNKVMYCFNCSESNEESIKTISTICTSATPTSNCAKEGNGYARITLVSLD